MSPDLLKALQSLDPTNDDHWTGDGLPKLDVVKLVLGRDIARSDLTKESKGFSRKNLTLPETTTVAAATGTLESTDEADAADGSIKTDTAGDLSRAEQAVEQAEKVRRAAYDALTVEAGARLVRTTAEQAGDIKVFQEMQQAQRKRLVEQTKLFSIALASQTPQPK